MVSCLVLGVWQAEDGSPSGSTLCSHSDRDHLQELRNRIEGLQPSDEEEEDDGEPSSLEDIREVVSAVANRLEKMGASKVASPAPSSMLSDDLFRKFEDLGRGDEEAKVVYICGLACQAHGDHPAALQAEDRAVPMPEVLDRLLEATGETTKLLFLIMDTCHAEGVIKAADTSEVKQLLDDKGMTLVIQAACPADELTPDGYFTFFWLEVQGRLGQYCVYLASLDFPGKCKSAWMKFPPKVWYSSRKYIEALTWSHTPWPATRTPWQAKLLNAGDLVFGLLDKGHVDKELTESLVQLEPPVWSRHKETAVRLRPLMKEQDAQTQLEEYYRLLDEYFGKEQADLIPDLQRLCSASIAEKTDYLKKIIFVWVPEKEEDKQEETKKEKKEEVERFSKELTAMADLFPAEDATDEEWRRYATQICIRQHHEERRARAEAVWLRKSVSNRAMLTGALVQQLQAKLEVYWHESKEIEQKLKSKNQRLEDCYPNFREVCEPLHSAVEQVLKAIKQEQEEMRTGEQNEKTETMEAVLGNLEGMLTLHWKHVTGEHGALRGKEKCKTDFLRTSKLYKKKAKEAVQRLADLVKSLERTDPIKAPALKTQESELTAPNAAAASSSSSPSPSSSSLVCPPSSSAPAADNSSPSPTPSCSSCPTIAGKQATTLIDMDDHPTLLTSNSVGFDQSTKGSHSRCGSDEEPSHPVLQEPTD